MTVSQSEVSLSAFRLSDAHHLGANLAKWKSLSTGHLNDWYELGFQMRSIVLATHIALSKWNTSSAAKHQLSTPSLRARLELPPVVPYVCGFRFVCCCACSRGKSIAMDVLRGLHFLHSKRIVHLDLKSPNILLTRHGVAKLADVGLAKVIRDRNYITQVSVIGTSTPHLVYLVH